MTIRRRLVLMSVAAFIVVLVAAGMVALGLLRNRLINNVDTSLNERQAALEQLLQLVPIDQLEGFAADRPQLGGTDIAVIGLAPDGSVIGTAPSGAPDDPDPLPVLDPTDIERLQAGETPFTVGGNDGYRVTAVVPEGEQITVVLAQPLDDVALTMRQTLLVLLVVGAGASVVLAGAIWFFIRRELQPLDGMAETADRITEGDLSKRVVIDRPSNEVGRLGGALNSMLGRIEDAVAAKTESESKMRRFVADASHELRTPLTSIRGYAELYRAGADTPDHVARSFERIEQEATRMGGLVEDLVLLARIDQERPFTTTEVDLGDVVRDTATDARAIEPDREVTAHVGKGSMVVEGDADRLRQVVANLLGNVRTHTDPDTPATVSRVRKNSVWVLALGSWARQTVWMRGSSDPQMAMLMSLSPDELIPASHPIRRIRRVVDDVLAELDAEFDVMYAGTGRRSVPPESLLKATVLMALYSIRSERAFCERLNYDLLFKWFLDMPIDARAFDPTTFTKNRQRLLDHEIADRFFEAVVTQAKLRRYTSSGHFSVDGTLLDAWASHKSFKPKDHSGDGDGGHDGSKGRNSEQDWKGKQRSNETHASTTDPEARLYRKSNNTAAELCYAGHLLIENRSALIVDAELGTADGYAERSTALDMLSRLPKTKRRRTVAGDKNYDTKGFVTDARGLGFTPHVAQNTTNRKSAIDSRTTRHPGYRISQTIRARVEEPFGWIKTIGGGHKLRYIGRDRNRAWFKMTAAVYNIIRIAALDTATT